MDTAKQWEKIRVAIYCRLSDEDHNKKNPEEDSRSIQTQKAMLRDYVHQQGWEIYDIYSDDDYSGADSSRPEYNRLLQDAEAKKFDIVLCKHQSRFTRDMVHVETYINEKFKEWGIRYISLLDGADTFLMGNKKSRQINGMVNEWYLEDLSESIRKAYVIKKKEGKYLSSSIPYGYKRDPDDLYHLIVDEPSALVVRKIFDMCIDGKSLNRIARTLNEEGILTPGQYKKEVQKLNHKGAETLRRNRRYSGECLWQNSMVLYILDNEIYTGSLYQNKKKTISYKNHKTVKLPREEWIVVENTHEPIISREEFETAKKSRAARKKWGNTVFERKHFFAGKLVCGCCGGALICTTMQEDREYYGCRYKVDLRKCRGTHVAGTLLKQEVHNELKRIITMWNKEEMVNLVHEGIDVAADEQVGDENRANKLLLIEELGKIKMMKVRLYNDLSEGTITENDYKELSVYYSQKQIELKQEIAELELLTANESSSCNEDQKKGLKQQIMDSADYYLNCEELTREMIQNFVDYIVVRNGETPGDKHLTIHWNF